MFCEECGVKQPDNSVFCSNCGNQMASLASDVPVAKTVQAPVKPIPVPVSPTPMAPPPIQQAASRPAPQVAPGSGYQQQPLKIDPLTAPLSVGSYMGMFILMAIPIVNFIMMLIWLFASDTNKNKKNFAIAMVLFSIIMIVISVLLSGIIFAFLTPFFQDIQYNTY